MPESHTIVYTTVPAAADVRLTLPLAAFAPAHPSPAAPPLAVQEVASADVHVNAVASPAVSKVGLAVNVTDGTVNVTDD